MDKLDRLEERISARSTMAPTTSMEAGSSRGRVGDTEEDQEIKQMLFRKLAMFRNKHSGDNKHS